MTKDSRLDPEEMYTCIAGRVLSMVKVGQSIFGSEEIRPQTPQLFLVSKDEGTLPWVEFRRPSG